MTRVPSRPRRSVPALLLVLLAACAAHAHPASLIGRVIRVQDGDSIVVRLGNGRTERVRYIGINAPEFDQRGGREARDANRKLVAGRSVRLERDVQERDRHGRLLAYVYVGDTMVNAELVAQGWAQAMTVPPNVSHQELFLDRERQARARQVGIWHPSRR